MKILKQNDGYALPFVLVVSVVMCIIATTVMTFSLNNLQSQQRTVERMQAKYEAAGAIEEIVGAIEMTTNQDGENNLLVAQETNSGIVFIGDDSCSFAVDDQNILRIASSAAYGDGEDLWVIAGLKLSDAGDVTITDFPLDSLNCTMTISGHGSIEYVWYEIVDQTAAYDFLRDAVPQQNGEKGDASDGNQS